jgi:polyhydroxyalkanoate synthesis regulator phasin
MANETNEYTEAYAAALGVATDSKITHDTLVAFRTEINFLRREVEGLRVTVAELTTIALGDDKFDRWFDDKFGDSLTTLVEEQVRENVESIVDDNYIEERIDLGNYNVNDYIDTDSIAREVIESDKIQDKIEEIVNDALDSIEVQLVR